MRRLRALIVGLPVDSAVWRQPRPEPAPPRPRQSSSLETIRKIGGNVIEIHRDKVG